jgi:hypothetical protein
VQCYIVANDVVDTIMEVSNLGNESGRFQLLYFGILRSKTERQPNSVN